MTWTPTLSRPIVEYIEGSNSFDGERLAAAFAEDALVNDARRELRGAPAIKRWADEEVLGDKVTMHVTEMKEHSGDFVVDALTDGEFDRTGLPDDLILAHYFTVRDDRAVSLIIIRNMPVE